MTPNNDEVICPNCVHQFRAIPQNVQQLMLDAGFKPPFTTPPQRKPMIDEQKNSERYLFLRNNANAEQAESAWRAAMRNRGTTMDEVIDRAIEAAHGIKE